MFLRRNQKGFTLLEVMLVVIIIGIIAIIALPRLLVALERARDESCDSNVQAIKTQLEQYYWVYTHFPAGTSIAGLLADADFFPADSTASSRCVNGTTVLSYAGNTDGKLVCPNHSNEPGAWKW